MAFTSHPVGDAISIYLAGRLFDLSSSYTVVYVVGIALLLGAALASYVIQERRYFLKTWRQSRYKRRSSAPLHCKGLVGHS